MWICEYLSYCVDAFLFTFFRITFAQHWYPLCYNRLVLAFYWTFVVLITGFAFEPGKRRCLLWPFFSVIKLPEWERLPEFRPGIKYFNQITYVHLTLLISTWEISKQDVPVVMYRKVRPSKNFGFGSKRTCHQTSLLFNVVVSSGYVYYVRTVRVPTCRVVPEVWRNVDIVIVVIINIITMLKKVLLPLLLLLGE